LATQTSADLSQALAPQAALQFAPAAVPPGVPTIHVNDAITYQRFTGVGAAMTDSSAWLIWNELGADQRSSLLNALFSASGAHLSFLRVPIGASDYTVGTPGTLTAGVPYSYDDNGGQPDPSLANFSVAHDQAYILPALRAAESLNPSLYTEAVPWSPPGWMKSNDALDDTDHTGSLLPQYYPTLAQYLVRFLQAYQASGVRISAITPQNEPDVPTQYPGMDLTEAQEAQFIASDLRPALAQAGLAPDIFAWDLSWGPLTAQSDPSVQQAASGLVTGEAWHCYFGNPADMTGVYDAAPNSTQIVDECSTGSGDTWPTAELEIAALRNYASAVALALDPNGQPVQPPDSGCGGCTGVVTVNEQTGTYTLSKDYYQLAQLSHFVAPGAVRIASENFVSYSTNSNYQEVTSPGLDDVAFRNPDGSEALLAYNTASGPITFAVAWHGEALTDTLNPGATVTLSWR
jgi:glucosylceramidase